MSDTAVMAGAAFITLTLDDAKLRAGLERATSQLEKFQKSVEIAVNQIGRATTFMTYPIVKSIQTFAQFDDTMRMVQATTQTTEASLAMLTEEAKRLGRETSFTASQVAEGMLSLGRMGLKPQEIKTAIHSMMNLARVTGTDLSEAAQIASNNLKTFELETSQITHVADILTVTANSSAQTLVDLGEALKMAAPHAKRAGADLTETAACLGILANMGIRGSLAGTALGKSYKRLADPKVMQYLDQFDIKTVDGNKNLRNMRDILLDISRVMASMGSAEQITFTEEIFDARGSLGGGTLSVNTDKIDEMIDKLKNAEGAAKQAAEKADQGLGGALRRLQSAVEGVNNAIGEIISVTFAPLIADVTALVSVIRNLIVNNKGLVSGFLRVYAAALMFSGAFKAITSTIGLFKSVLSPILMMEKYLTGASAAAAGAEKAEKIKLLAKKKSDAIRIASDNRRHYMELKNAASAAQAVIVAEAKKLSAAKARFAAEAAMNEKARYQYTLLNGSSAGFQNLPNFTAAQKDLAAQQKNLQNCVAAYKKQAEAATQAKNATMKSLAVARQAAFAHTLEGNSLFFAKKKAVVYGNFLGKLSAGQLFRIALTKRHHAAVMAASITEIVAAKKTAGASAIKTAGYYAEATGAKVAAYATAGLSKMLAVISSHPVIFALIALAAAYQTVKWASERAVEAQEKEVRIAERAKQEAINERVALEDRIKAERKSIQSLMNMEKQGKLSAEQMHDAQSIINNLTEQYGDLGIQLDTLTGQITGTADAYHKLDEEQRKALINKMQTEADTHKRNADSKRKSFDAKFGFFDKIWAAYTLGNSKDFELMMKMGFTKERFKWDLSDADNGANLERMRAAYNWAYDNGMTEEAEEIKKIIEDLEKAKKSEEEIAKLRKGGDVVKSNESAGNFGSNGSSDNVKEIKDIDDELARMDEERARKNRSALENEINEIEKARAEYKKLAAAKLEALEANQRKYQKEMDANYAQNTKKQKQTYSNAAHAFSSGQKEIQDLKDRLAAADADYDQQRAEKVKKHAEKVKKQAEEEKKQADKIAERDSGYLNFIAAFEKTQAKEENDRKMDAEFERINNGRWGQEADRKAFMQKLADSLNILKIDYKKALTNYISDTSDDGKTLSEKERAKLDDMQQKIREADQKLITYQSRLRAAADTVEEKADVNRKTISAFDAAAISSIFGRDGRVKQDREERIAKSTEKTVDILNRIYKKHPVMIA